MLRVATRTEKWKVRRSESGMAMKEGKKRGLNGREMGTTPRKTAKVEMDEGWTLRKREWEGSKEKGGDGLKKVNILEKDI